MHIDPTLTLAQFLGSLPTFIAVILAWLNSNARASDMRQSLEAKIEDKFQILNNKIDHTREILSADLHRVEEVIDARLKHLEQHEH